MLSLLRTGARLLLLLVLLVITAAVALLLPLAVLQHLLIHPPELGPALLTLATSITIALLLLGISLRVHVTESGGLQLLLSC